MMRDDWPIWGIGLVCVGLIAALIYNEAVVWPAYRAAHDCRLTGDTRQAMYWQHSGDVTYPVYYMEAQWRCDADETLWRPQ